MKRIFITGICGFVGSNLALYFQSMGNKVYGIDNFSRKGSKKNLNLLKRNGIKVFKGNLINLKKNKIFKEYVNFDAFIHCAALTSVLDGINNNSSEFLYKNNILSTLESLKLCHFLKSKFIYISSSRVYGISEINKLKLKISDNSFKLKKNSKIGISHKGINEEFSTKPPLSMYGSSKLACENIVQEYCAFYRIPFVINRCGLLSGSGQLYKNDQGIISYWINSWKKRKKLNYIGFGGKGTQARDCLHPLDLSKLIKKKVKNLEIGKTTDPINIPGGYLILKLEDKKIVKFNYDFNTEFNNNHKSFT